MPDSRERLRAEIAALQAENERLKAELATPDEERAATLTAPESLRPRRDGPAEAMAADAGGINQKSPAEDKLALFMELFRGREDVYAKRWHSAKTNKSGWSPVCRNEWVSGICDKKRYKCAACPRRSFSPPDSAAYFRHLSGKSIDGADTLALYPLTADDCCYFLAIKFNGGAWREDAAAFRQACADYALSPAIERMDENCARLWFFFGEKVPAAPARRFGSALLTAAMNLRHEIPFGLYDSLYPGSDVSPRGLFCAPMPLPLHGRARKSGHGVFVDENHVPVADQWAYLSQLRCVSLSTLEEVIRQSGGNTELGLLASADEDDDIEPWKLGGREASLSAMDFSETVDIVRANMLHISREGISQAALNRIRRLGAFRNPEYAKAERMRLPIRELPRIVDCSRESREYLSLPRGCEEALKTLLEAAGAAYEIEDKRNAGKPINVEFDGELRPEQKPAAKAMLRHETGVLSATTAFGKTVLGAYLIAKKRVNALILVHTTALLQQWKKALEQFLTINEALPEDFDKRGRRKAISPVGRLGGGKNELRGIVDIAVMQSLVSGDEVRELVRDYGLVIVDECHHVSAVSFEKILRQVSAKHVYGLTATPTRQDGLQPIIFMQCGAIRYRVNPKEQAAKAGFERYVVPRFTRFTALPEADGKAPPITSLYAQTAEDPARNALILKDIKYALKKGRTPIILTRLTSHVDFFASALDGICHNVIALTGKASAKEKRGAMERLKAIPEGESFVIAATGQFVGEGFDEPRLDTLFMASPIAWHGTLQQYAGRLHRTYPGKENVTIFDYVDVSVRMLEAMFHKRVKGYTAMGYRAAIPGGKAEKQGAVFEAVDFQPAFARDSCSARREIVIISPKLRQSYTERVLKILSSARINGVTIIVVTGPAMSYKPEERESAAALLGYLRECGLRVVERHGTHQNCAVIDRKTVWYGSVNLLGYSPPEASIMRFENPDIAAEFLAGL